MNIKNELNVFTNKVVPFTSLGGWKYNIKLFFHNIRHAWQRITQGYCDIDIWDLNCYYARIIVASMKAFAVKTDTIPNGMTETEWIAIIDEIIHCFQIAAKYTDDFVKELQQEDGVYSNSSKSLVEYRNKAEKIKQSNAERGFYLLGKYFSHFWY